MLNLVLLETALADSEIYEFFLAQLADNNRDKSSEVFMEVIVIFWAVTPVILYADIDVSEEHRIYHFIFCEENKIKSPRSGTCSCLSFPMPPDRP